ncbi:MAG: amino acid permease [Thermoplasmata archaeon]|uniref:Amino acid permease n=1 Tax=Candidatus Sysuiplasma superficiale TaxID=2823368 RepID=A0A8J8CCF0_9ARCH|nr:amino acid permease [Candidatus Sysuiplasma superficiale]MBX8643584.1 amino acid permease [Candidatus Sysuiplasma superficiale]
MLSLGGIIGSGWLFAVLAANADAGPAVTVSWIIGGILVLFIALNYAEVSGMIPRSGAIVRYPHLSHGSYTGYILGWTYMLSAVTVPTIEAEAVVGYAATYVPSFTYTTSTLFGPVTVLSASGIALALVLLVFFFFLNFYGIRFLGRFNQYITWWKFIIPALTFILLFSVFNASNFTNASYGGFTPFGWGPVFLAIPTAGIVFSYLGFRQALEYGGEAKNPQKDVPKATIVSVLIGIGLYTLLQIAFTGSINWSHIQLVNSAGSIIGPIRPGDWAALKTSTWASGPFYNALKSSGLSLLAAFAVFLLIDAWVSPSGTGWVYMGTGTRTFYGLGADGYFPKWFTKLSKYRIPWISLIAALIVGLIFLLPFPSWYLLVGFISSATVFTYVMGGVALQVFRKTAPTMKRPFRLPGALILAPIGFVAASMIVYWSGITLVIFLVYAIFAGLPLYIILYGPAKLGIKRGVAAAIGIVFWIVLGVLFDYGYGIITLGVSESTPGVVSSIGNGMTAATLDGRFLLFFVLTAILTLGTTAIIHMLTDREKRKEISSGYWLVAFSLGMLFLSYFGAFGYDTVVPFPWDNVVAIVLGIVFYIAAVMSGYKTEDITDILATEGVPAPAVGASEAPEEN